MKVGATVQIEDNITQSRDSNSLLISKNFLSTKQFCRRYVIFFIFPFTLDKFGKFFDKQHSRSTILSIELLIVLFKDGWKMGNSMKRRRTSIKDIHQIIYGQNFHFSLYFFSIFSQISKSFFICVAFFPVLHV